MIHRGDLVYVLIITAGVLGLITVAFSSCARSATNTGHDWLRHFPYRDMVDVPFYFERRYHGPREIEDPRVTGLRRLGKQAGCGTKPDHADAC